ncbi:MAG: hypothetical protein J5I94_13580 [Phaeodactylibacter sp.]|nr:hypothetical protein [Phaeodactylibacter sp.]
MYSKKVDAASMVARPQMRLVINEGLLVGIVPGIPVNIEGERLSAFMRLIYEPGHQRLPNLNPR